MNPSGVCTNTVSECTCTNLSTNDRERIFRVSTHVLYNETYFLPFARQNNGLDCTLRRAEKHASAWVSWFEGVLVRVDSHPTSAQFGSCTTCCPLDVLWALQLTHRRPSYIRLSQREVKVSDVILVFVDDSTLWCWLSTNSFVNHVSAFTLSWYPVQ